MILSELVIENPALLLFSDHFEIDYLDMGKTIKMICRKYQVSEVLFLAFCNMYNGFIPESSITLSKDDLDNIIRFLKRSHVYYREEKYPEIQNYIHKLSVESKSKEIKLIERFFIEYFNEVNEHIEYEDSVAFPYFEQLINSKKALSDNGVKKYSVKEYKEHHDDIETKLTDLKNLILNHISLSEQRSLRRKLLFSLFELEYDLNIHAQIEEMILIPLVVEIEKNTE